MSGVEDSHSRGRARLAVRLGAPASRGPGRCRCPPLAGPGGDSGLGGGLRLALGSREFPRLVGAPQESRSLLGPGAQALAAQGLTFLRSHSVCTESFRAAAAPARRSCARPGRGHRQSVLGPQVGGGGRKDAPTPFHGRGSSSQSCTSAGTAPGSGRLLPSRYWLSRPLRGLDCGRGPSSGGEATGLGSQPASPRRRRVVPRVVGRGGGPGRGRSWAGPRLLCLPPGRALRGPPHPPPRPLPRPPAPGSCKGISTFFLCSSLAPKASVYLELSQALLLQRLSVRARGTGGPGSWRSVPVPFCTRWTRPPFSAPRAWGRASAFVSLPRGSARS